MQAHLLVGPISVDCAGGGGGLFLGPCSWPHRRSRSRIHHRRRGAVIASAAVNGNRNHYAVLGISHSASSADIKRAYRLLARKYHPDVSKDAQAGEVFKSIRLAYETLNNEATRTQYDRELKYQEDNGRPWRGNQDFDPELEDRVRIYRWAELRRKTHFDRYWEHYDFNEENDSFDSETDEVPEEATSEERGSFFEVLRSVFISLFLVQTFGSWLSLTFTSSMALFDKKLDAGYKLGYIIAWALGGRGGILLTLCLSFASWVCGKTSSSVVVLVVVAMWVGSSLARFAPLPQVAAVVRDGDGFFVAATVSEVPHVVDVDMTEAIGVLKGMELVASLGFKQVIFEGDSKNVMDVINGGSIPLNLMGSVIQDIFAMCSSFSCSEFIYVRRESNSVAHNLTREIFKSGNYVWTDCAPISISHCIQADLAV